MEKALSMSELLSLILANANKKTLARCARVSGFWFENAVPILWRSLDQIKILFLLFPRTGGIGKYKLHDDRDWVRFNVYSPHVRRLFIDRRELEYSTLPSALEEIAHTRRVPSLLPNLQELYMDPWRNAYSSLLFMHDGIERLTFNVSFSDALDILFVYIIPVARRLTYLCIKSGKAQKITHDREAIKTTLRSLKALKCLLICNIHAPAAILSEVALLPKLKRFYYSTDQPAPKAQKIRGGKKRKGLSKLEDINFHAGKEDFQEFLDLDIFYPNMKDLLVTITESDYIMLESLGLCYEMMSLKMNYLSNLYLQLGTMLENENSLTKVINLKCLRPLSNLHQMQNFSLSYKAPAIITDTNIEHLVSGWSRLISFRLEVKQAADFVPKSTLQVLQIFASHCNKLQFLSIAVDATRTIPQSQIAAPLIRLKCLHFGYSPIIHSEAVATYIGRFCTRSCQLIVPDGANLADGDSPLEEYRRMWNKVLQHLR